MRSIPEQANWTVSENGFATLGDDAARLLALLDEIFSGWAARAGARTMLLPPVLPVADLARLDVYQNFPQLAMVATTLEPARFADLGARPDQIAADAVQPARLGLPSAVCYGVYLHLRDHALTEDVLLTAVGTCYRNETTFEGLRRLGAFRMREVVAIGDSDHVLTHLARFSALTLEFAERAGLAVTREVATDPFYDGATPQALWQRVAPVKHEFVCDGLAIASVNEHRTFFGERCGIRHAGTGSTASSSCAAFGLERWVHVLSTRYEGDLDAAYQAVRRAGTEVSAHTQISERGQL